MQQSQSKTSLPVVVYGKRLQRCSSTAPLIRADTLRCSAVYPNVSVCSSDWTLHQACRFCLCMCVVCAHSVPTPGASQTWGVKRSLRMGFSNTGSFGTAASKHRQAEIPSVHVCVFIVIVRPYARVMCIFSWMNPPPVQTKFILRASHGGTITQNHEGANMLGWFLIIGNVRQKRQPDKWVWLGVTEGDVGRRSASCMCICTQRSELNTHTNPDLLKYWRAAVDTSCSGDVRGNTSTVSPTTFQTSTCS